MSESTPWDSMSDAEKLNALKNAVLALANYLEDHEHNSKGRATIELCTFGEVFEALQ